MATSLRRVMLVVVVLLIAFGLLRAATLKFQDQEKLIRDGCRADLQKQGMTRDVARGRYPTPEIHGVAGGCVAPGQTGEVVVTGRFSAGTRFVIENDSMQVVKDSLAGGQYRATVSVTGGIGPQTASIVAFSPFTCVTARKENAIVAPARAEWNMDASNGWKVIARPAGSAPCRDAANGDFPYEVTFYRKGESAPFAKRSAVLHFDVFSQVEPYTFRITEESAASSDVQDMQGLMQKMGDPKLTDAQRDQVMKDLEKLQARMQASIAKMVDPANVKKMEEERQNFGCQGIYAVVDEARSVKGRMSCSQKVGMPKLTGTVNLLAR